MGIELAGHGSGVEIHSRRVGDAFAFAAQVVVRMADGVRWAQRAVRWVSCAAAADEVAGAARTNAGSTAGVLAGREAAGSLKTAFAPWLAAVLQPGPAIRQGAGAFHDTVLFFIAEQILGSGQSPICRQAHQEKKPQKRFRMHGSPRLP